MKSIDLHGIKHADVRKTLDIFFWKMIQKNENEFKVITGYSETMKSIVKEICEEYDFSVESNFNNGGCLIIRQF